MITLLIYFVIICVGLWGVKMIVPMPPPFDKLFYVLCVVIALLYLLHALQVLGVIDSSWGPVHHLRR